MGVPHSSLPPLLRTSYLPPPPFAQQADHVAPGTSMVPRWEGGEEGGTIKASVGLIPPFSWHTPKKTTPGERGWMGVDQFPRPLPNPPLAPTLSHSRHGCGPKKPWFGWEREGGRGEERTSTLFIAPIGAMDFLDHGRSKTIFPTIAFWKCFRKKTGKTHRFSWTTFGCSPR